ncbi:MAG: hypothetical protein ACEQSK_15140 [Sphingomonadaceae bacterium]
MISTFPWWWLALPVLLLPLWWHRQKRQRLKAEPLATARFLPSAAPEQLRVWQWRDRILLLVRCLLLVALIAWLAALFFPWRGDTVLLDPAVPVAWAEQQIATRNLTQAQRIALPVDPLVWLRQHERDWRPQARLLIVAAAGKIGMPARLPQFAHQVELLVAPPAPPAATVAAVSDAPRLHHVVLAASPERLPAWRALFAAFDVAGSGNDRYVLTETPDASTELIVWDQPNASPPAAWRAPLWWQSATASTAAVPELAKATRLTIHGITLHYADAPRGRIWFSADWPVSDADGARALYDTWQVLAGPAPAYPAPAQAFASSGRAAPPLTDPERAAWLAYALLALFLIERILSHARRH